ncbi:kelch-like protein 26 [Phlebotomus argentipes]|uniref:kelch-like protein 26 n=1 Tax=Phlebotomus argentipes TaxID=94469 RepID=UPI0028931DBB|nr:kelch-like protein 26 [Phlebotomus argentipes]
MLDRTLNTIFFESLSHTNTLLNGLNELRLNGHLIDITLTANGRSFRAHRAVLASCSEYFRAMFTDAMKESQQHEISLNGVTAAGIELLLEYAYTSKLELNLANVQDVLSAASHIQLDAVVEACSNYLQSQLDVDNCVDIVSIAEMYSLDKLRQRVYRYICAHLSEFVKTHEICVLARHQLEHILACDYPVDCSEVVVLNIVLQWITKSEKTLHDVRTCSRLLGLVRLAEVSPSDVERTLQAVGVSSNCALFGLTKSLAQSQKRLVVPVSSQENALVNSRGMELALVKVGGFGLEGITNDITYYLPSVKKWRHLTSIPHVEQCNYGIATLRNELYVVGGCYNVCLKEYIHPFGFRFSPMSNSWTTIAPMQQDRCRFSLNFVGEFLYAVGGASEVDEIEDLDLDVGDVIEQQGSTAECYDPSTDKWTYIPSMPGNRTQHAGAAQDHFLYVSGGLDRHRVLSSFYRYNTKMQVWEQLPPMLTPRADHMMVSINERMYVCGGWTERSMADSRTLIDTIDVYNRDSCTWEVVTHIPTPRFHAGIVAVNTKIYIIGGFYSDSMFDLTRSVIECYDVESNQWTSVERYPQNIWECNCIGLYIPKCRDDMEVIVDDC